MHRFGRPAGYKGGTRKRQGVGVAQFILKQGGMPLGGEVGYPYGCMGVRVRVGSSTRKKIKNYLESGWVRRVREVVRKIDLERKKKGDEIVGEMRGKDINLTITAGADSIREIKVLKEDGSIYPMENIGVVGRIWGMREEGDGEEMECKVTDEGLIEVRFPGKGEGRYIFAVDGVSDDGQRERIIEGYVGYEGPAMKEVGNEDGTELLVYMDGERRKALFGRNMAWVSMYKASQEVAEQVKEVDKKLEKAEALDKAFSEKMSDFVQPDETTGTWIVGGVDTGKPYRGEDGADGQKIKRVIWDNDATLPSTGDGGTLLYVRNAAPYVTMSVDMPIYLYVRKAEDRPDFCGLKINGIEVLTGGFAPLSTWVDVLNRDYNFAVKAELISMRWMKLTAVYDGVQLSVPGSSVEEMYLQRYLGYAVYGWVDGRGWVNLENQLELEQLPLAGIGKEGVVKFVHSLTAADAGNGEAPSPSAIISFVRDQVKDLATKAELEPLATRYELGVFATKEELEPLATKEELEQAVAQTPSNVVSSAFGKKIVELSETEYSLLESYDEDTYYFTFAD